MKQLITASGAVILILAIIIELISVQIYCINIIKADYIMALHNDVIRQEGYITEECENKIKSDLSSIFRCEFDDTSVVLKNGEGVEKDYIIYEIKSKAGSLFNDKFWGMFKSDMEYIRKYALVSHEAHTERNDFND